MALGLHPVARSVLISTPWKEEKSAINLKAAGSLSTPSEAGRKVPRYDCTSKTSPSSRHQVCFRTLCRAWAIPAAASKICG